MRKSLSAFALALTLSGCLGSAPKSPVNWTIEAEVSRKVSLVTVCAPYDSARIAVLRPNGSIAFDSFNAFPASPSAIVRDLVTARRAGGALVVRKLALDCRAEGRRDALVELEIDPADGEPPSKGRSSVPTDDGNFSAAFSAAFSTAYEQALSGLKER